TSTNQSSRQVHDLTLDELQNFGSIIHFPEFDLVRPSWEAFLKQGQVFSLFERDNPVCRSKVFRRDLNGEARAIWNGTKSPRFQGFQCGNRHGADVVDASLQSQASGRSSPGQTHVGRHRVEKDFSKTAAVIIPRAK